MAKELEQWKRVAQESQETIQGLEAALGMQEQAPRGYRSSLRWEVSRPGNPVRSLRKHGNECR